MVVRRGLVFAVLVLAAGSMATVWWLAAPDRTAAAGGTATSMPPPTVQIDPTSPVRILTAWDERRASAWAAGDLRGLRDLYVAGSGPAREDVRRLKAYLDRDLRVEDLRMQVLALSVVQRDERSMVLEVTERLAGGSAVGPVGRRSLPAGQTTTRTVRLVLHRGTWLVDEVSPTGPRPARR
ncbi:hypothetical protein [Nocardioides sp.]|uniref:hypothetical protein n=1 Tax=Nocardioides sp. TaxID=35761 RepID=UPI00273418FC|nr:hypothetical protein [Nocardioides sp.]MDP3894064.1 hypothetical protein [Nocardioides sp.]